MKRYFAIITILLTLFSMKLKADSYLIDFGTTGKEYHLGSSSIYLQDKTLDFIFLSHTYLKNSSNFHFIFESHIGITSELITQKTFDPSYKNVYAGIIVGEKYKYFNGIFGFIPELSIGGVFHILSDNLSNEDNLLSFFLGIHIGTGASYPFSDKGGYGVKFDFQFGYNNYLDSSYPREFIMLFSIAFISLDYYE
ncbi:hypothetical protein JXR93_06310 [bacterium]|nr:hypothetical protein [bacterium]